MYLLKKHLSNCSWAARDILSFSYCKCCPWSSSSDIHPAFGKFYSWCSCLIMSHRSSCYWSSCGFIPDSADFLKCCNWSSWRKCCSDPATDMFHWYSCCVFFHPDAVTKSASVNAVSDPSAEKAERLSLISLDCHWCSCCKWWHYSSCCKCCHWS